jgi:hypothetical protein
LVQAGHGTMMWLSSRSTDFLISKYQYVTWNSQSDDLKGFGQFLLVDTAPDSQKIAFIFEYTLFTINHSFLKSFRID